MRKQVAVHTRGINTKTSYPTWINYEAAETVCCHKACEKAVLGRSVVVFSGVLASKSECEASLSAWCSVTTFHMCCKPVGAQNGDPQAVLSWAYFYSSMHFTHNRASFSMLCSPLWEMCAPIITTKYFSPVLQTECPFYEKMTCDDSIDVFPKWRPTCVLHWIVACQSSASRSQSGRDKVMTMSMPILCTFLLISGQAAFFARCRGWSRYLLFISAAEDLNAHDPTQSFRRL